MDLLDDEQSQVIEPVEENVNTNTEAIPDTDKNDEKADENKKAKSKTKDKQDLRFNNTILTCDYPMKSEEEAETFVFFKEELVIDTALAWDEPSEKKDITDAEIKGDSWALHNGVLVKIESVEGDIATLLPEEEAKKETKIEIKPVEPEKKPEPKSQAELDEEEMINQAIALSLQESTKVEETKPEETKPEETKPEETKPEEVKPEEAKPEEAITEEVKPEETKTEEVVVTDTTEVKTEQEKVETSVAVEGETKQEEEKKEEEKKDEAEVKKPTVPVKELKTKAEFKFTVNTEEKQIRYPDLELDINQTISTIYSIISEIISLPKEKFVLYIIEEKKEQDCYECLCSIMNANRTKPHEIIVFIKGIIYKSATMKRSTSRDYSLTDKKHLSVFKVTHPITLTGVGFNRHYYDANLAKYDMRIYKYDEYTKRKQLLLTMNGIEVKTSEVDSNSYIKMVKIDSLDLDANIFYLIYVDFAIDDMRTYYFYSGSATIEENGVWFTFYNVSGVKERISYTNGMSGWLDFTPRKLLD
jgi:hypothetical protein